MEILSKYISDKLLYSLGWTIFHSIWIGALVSILLFIALAMLGRASAKARYNISLGALIILAGLVVSVFAVTMNSSKAESIELPSVSLLLSDQDSPSLPSGYTDISKRNFSREISSRTVYFLNNNYGLISLLWMAGMLFMAIRFTGGYIKSASLRRVRNSRPLEKYSELIYRIKNRMFISRPVMLVESIIAGVPMTAGWLKPVIYIPVGALAGIPYNQVEAILAHELAHIKRKDYLVNLFQSFIEILLFYHPATWWISSVIRSERENACDDIAIEHSDEKLTYIKALVSISSFDTAREGAAVAFAGDSNNLLNRIKRIAKMKNGKMNSTDKWTSALMSIIIIAGVLILSGFRAEPGIDESHNKSAAILAPITLSEYSSFPVLAELLQDPVKISGKITKTISDPADGKEKDATFTYKEGELSSLTIDGKEIPKSEYQLYKSEAKEAMEELIDIREDMEEAMIDIEEAMEEIEDIDMAEIEMEIQEALSEIEGLDIEDMEFEIQEALAEIEDLDIEDLEIDMQDMLSEVEESLKEIEEINLQEIELEMQEAIEKIKELDIEKMREEMLESIKEVEAINIDEIMKEMEKSMQMIEESLKDLEVDQRQNIEHQRKSFEAQKKELENKLIELQEQESEKEVQAEAGNKKKKEKIL